MPCWHVIGVYLATPDPMFGELRRAFTNTYWNERDLAFGSMILEQYQRLLLAHIDAILRQSRDVIFPRERPA